MKTGSLTCIGETSRVPYGPRACNVLSRFVCRWPVREFSQEGRSGAPPKGVTLTGDCAMRFFLGLATAMMLSVLGANVTPLQAAGLGCGKAHRACMGRLPGFSGRSCHGRACPQLCLNGRRFCAKNGGNVPVCLPSKLGFAPHTGKNVQCSASQVPPRSRRFRDTRRRG